METTELITYLKENKASFPKTIHIGGGATVANTESFLKSHLNALDDPDMRPQHKELYVLRLQHFYDAVQVLNAKTSQQE